MFTEEEKRVYRQAAYVIRKYGWTRGLRQSSDGQYCLVGAIEKVKHGFVRQHIDGPYDPYMIPEVVSLGYYLGYKENPGMSLAYWNDDHTEERVLELLDSVSE